MFRFCLRLLTLVSLCAFLETPCTIAQAPPENEEVIKISQDFDNAELRRDFHAIARMLAGDVIRTTFGGTVFDRAQAHEHLQPSESKFELWPSDQVRIRVYGDAAVVTARLTRKARKSRRDLSGESRYAPVYARRNGSRQMVAYQVIQITEPGQRPNSGSSQKVTEDEAAIRKIIRENTDAWNRRDVKALVSYLTDETDHINVNGAWRSGRAETEKALSAALETTRINMASSVDKIRFVTPDVAIAVIRRDYTDDKETRKAISTSVFHKINGEWRVEAFQNAFVQPPERSSSPNPRAESAQLPADPVLAKTVQAREAALAAGDSDTWGRLTTDDFLRIEVDGTVTTKAERMARLKAEPMRPRERSERLWRIYGTTAIETWRQSRPGQVTRITQVWVRLGGQWRVAGVHMSAIAKP